MFDFILRAKRKTEDSVFLRAEPFFFFFKQIFKSFLTKNSVYYTRVTFSVLFVLSRRCITRMLRLTKKKKKKCLNNLMLYALIVHDYNIMTFYKSRLFPYTNRSIFAYFINPYLFKFRYAAVRSYATLNTVFK